jgi:hypothetical protein
MAWEGEVHPLGWSDRRRGRESYIGHLFMQPRESESYIGYLYLKWRDLWRESERYILGMEISTARKREIHRPPLNGMADPRRDSPPENERYIHKSLVL